MKVSKREFILSSLKILGTEILLESVRSTFGESDSLLSDIEMQGNYDENESLLHWLWLCDKAKTESIVIDVGAYSGLYSIFAVSRNPLVKAFALEASTVTYGRLIKNLFLNNIESRIVAGRFAAWNAKTYIKIKHKWGIYTTCAGDSCIGEFEEDHEEDVPCIPLDLLTVPLNSRPGTFSSKSSFIKDVNNIIAIKIDVEGAEPSVLIGAHSILEKYRPFIILEILAANALSEIQNICVQYNYNIQQIGSERNYLMIPEELLNLYKTEFPAWRQKISSKDQLELSRKIIFTT
jgi:FkbM family methyltransferase